MFHTNKIKLKMLIYNILIVPQSIGKVVVDIPNFPHQENNDEDRPRRYSELKFIQSDK